MTFGVNTLIWALDFQREHFQLLPRIREAGFESVEILMLAPERFDSAGIRRAVEDAGLELTICALMSKGAHLIAEDAATRRAGFDRLLNTINRSAEAGAKLICGPVYAPVGYLPGRRRTQDEWAHAVDAYQRATSLLETTGITLAVEPLNRFETYFLNTIADGVQLCDAVGHSQVGLLVDTFHSNIEEKNVPGAYRLADRHLKHVHASENDRGTPGTGHTDWRGVFDALEGIGYTGRVTIESFGFCSGELSAAASIWRDLAATPDEIAFQGVRFLRGCTSRTAATS